MNKDNGPRIKNERKRTEKRTEWRFEEMSKREFIDRRPFVGPEG